MNKCLTKIGLGLLAGCGIGLIIGKRKVNELEAKLDNLIAINKHLHDTNDDLVRCNNNLRMVNKWQTDILLGQDEED